MLTNFNLSQFIKSHVTGRSESLLHADFEKYNTDLYNRINNKKVLVIRGAGTIGTFYIKAILKFNIAKLVVVAINGIGAGLKSCIACVIYLNLLDRKIYTNETNMNFNSLNSQTRRIKIHREFHRILLKINNIMR